jgi:hypothetical protein
MKGKMRLINWKLAVCLAALNATVVLSAAEISVRADDAMINQNELGRVLGAPAASWRITQNAKLTFTQVVGQAAMSVGTGGATMTQLAPSTTDRETRIRFGFAPAAEKGASLELMSSLPAPDASIENAIRLNLSAPAVAMGKEREYLNWSLPASAGRATNQNFPSWIYRFRRIPSLEAMKLWPAFVRARTLRDMQSQPKLEERWFEARFVLRQHEASIYLDDRLLSHYENAAIDTDGVLRLVASEGVRIASIQTRALPAVNEKFELIELDRYLNASKFGAQSLAPNALPSGTSTSFGGVPFQFPTPDRQGNNHLDVGCSWLRGGMLSGGGDPAEGDDARWIGALDVDPSRLQFRVPSRQYSALHLIAASTGEADTIPRLTAQFYRQRAGFPVNFKANVPVYTAKAQVNQVLPLRLANGKTGHLYHIIIPLEPEGLDSFSDREALEFELTKDVAIYRAYPDPFYFSEHGAGLPSGVHVFAMTLERPSVEVNFQPDRFAHIWTAPSQPSYTVRLHNQSNSPQKIQLQLNTQSHDTKETTKQSRTVTLAAQGTQTVKIPLHLKRYGLHRVVLRVRDGEGLRTRTRALAYLHPDTRERGNWDESKGLLFGFWDWRGGHETPGGIPRLQVMADAGAESPNRSFEGKTNVTPGKMESSPPMYSDEEKEYARSRHMASYFALATDYFVPGEPLHLGIKWDASKPEEMEQALTAAIRRLKLPETALNKPQMVFIWGEPNLGPISYRSLPEYYGEPPYQMTPDEQKNFEEMNQQFIITARVIKKEMPGVKVYMPWGSPQFPVAFSRNSPEATALMDGPGLDMVPFQRLPEAQVGQVTLHAEMWQLKQEWEKTGKPWPHLTAMEGPCVSRTALGSLNEQEEADHNVRSLLNIVGYGANRLLGTPSPFECADAWGEQQYGGGMIKRLPILTPKPFYVAYATMTRQLNRANFVKLVPTGSATVFCMQFKHYKTGELIHVFWTIRGTRPVMLQTKNKIDVFDDMDNLADVKSTRGGTIFTVSSSPVYVHGLTSTPVIALGTPNHSDAKPAVVSDCLSNLSNGSWKLSSARDEDYEKSHDEFVVRFPGAMSTRAVKDAGKNALAIHLAKQPKERATMPFYSTLIPAKPILIPGKASHLGLWVKANSDWGRVVYFLRDSKGEKWISVGKANEWNDDDQRGESVFCFDGWRYLRFELPSNAPYDLFREVGSTWWGSYSKDKKIGDEIVDLPLTLEKIVVERRTHVIVGNELIRANTADVLLGDLYAEYSKPQDKTPEAIRLSELRMKP